MLSSPVRVHTPKSEKIRGSFSILVAKWLVAGLLLFLHHCKLIAPDSFLDPTPDSNELLKTINVRNNGELWSGVVAGDLPAGVTGVEARFDDGPWKKAEVTGNRWRVFIPTGAEAAAGKQRWQVGSKHTLAVRGSGPSGNTRSAASLSFTRHRNKDANGDGYSDLVVGAHQNDGGTGATSKGAAYIHYGSANGVISHALSASPDACNGPGDCTVVQNPLHEAYGSFGYAVNFIGDSNGDGYGDIVVGAYQNDGGTGAADKGAAYIYYGSANGITPHLLVASPYLCNGPADCTVIQNPLNESSGRFGSAVSSAGDVNGDGYDDLLVGAYINDGGTGASDKGAAYVFYGSASGIMSQPLSASAYVCSGSADCTVIQNPLHEANGFFGYSLGPAGDVNGDGYGDVIVGAFRNHGGTGALRKGAAYIFYGSMTGVTSHPLSASPYSCTAVSDCTAIQNPLHEVDGFFGSAVGFAGDVNNDGFSDVIVGAYQNDGGTGALDKGVVYVFYGSSTGITAHQLSASPYACGGPGDCTTIQNPLHEASGRFGFAVSFAGDVNRDGYGDILVGASANDDGVGAVNKGAAYIFYGSVTGVIGHDLSITSYTCSNPADCTTIQNPLDEANGSFGSAVGMGGDLNGDGYADAVIGAYTNDGGAGAGDKGAAYVFYGGVTGIIQRELSSSSYNCSGQNGCSVIQNPLHQPNGYFGYSVGSLAPALRPSPASLNHPGTPSPFMARGWGCGQDALPARREEDIA
ncbi:MAG: integrin alpha [Spirochaetota bacterium]